MGKIILALLTAAIVWVFFKGLTKKPPNGGRPVDVTKPNPHSPPASNLGLPERMVKCARCGVFMPETESVAIEGKMSCRDPKTCGHVNAPERS